MSKARGKSQRRQGKPRRSHSLRQVLLSAVLLVLTGGFALAQTPLSQALPAKKYMNDNVILLPVHIEPRFLNELKEVQLYVKDQPSSPWTLAGTASPGQKEFFYKASKDGEYWFTLMTVNKQGQPSVNNLAAQPPQAIVVLDREPPAVQMNYMGSFPAGQCVKCQVMDQYLDSSSFRFEYQTRDKIWRELEPISGSFDTYCVPGHAAITGLVRFTATDRCGNKTQKVLNLQECNPDALEFTASKKPLSATTQQPPAIPQPPTPKPVIEPQYPPGVGTQPEDGPELQPTGNFPPLPVQGHEVTDPNLIQVKHTPENDLPDAPAKPESSFVHPSLRTAQGKEVVNQTNFTLNYQVEEVGRSGVGKVEVWITKDLGKSWQFLVADNDRKSPVELELPGEGLFGLTLVATNGLGFGGEPPAPGYQPDWWVEVDTTRPQAQLMSVDLLKGSQSGSVMITWVVNDKNLLEEPIDLYYAVEASGSWLPIARGLPNSGQYRWQFPQVAGGRVYVRLAANDRGGNVGISQTPQAIQLDDGTRPKIRIQGINHSSSPSSPTLVPSLGQ